MKPAYLKNAIGLAVLFSLFFLWSFKAQNPSAQGNKNVVPDQATAIKLAETTWITIHGVKMNSQTPLKAVLKGDSVWVVTGTIPPPAFQVIDGDTFKTNGGKSTPAIVEIRKSNGEILKVSQGN